MTKKKKKVGSYILSVLAAAGLLGSPSVQAGGLSALMQNERSAEAFLQVITGVGYRDLLQELLAKNSIDELTAVDRDNMEIIVTSLKRKLTKPVAEPVP